MEKENLTRTYILNVIRMKPLTISELAKRFQVSRPTIYLHLAVLEKAGLIRRRKDHKKKGAPVTIFSVEKAVAKKQKGEIITFLKSIEQAQPISLKDLHKKNPHIISNHAYMQSSLNGFIDKMVHLTPAGVKFLNENKE